MLRVLAKSRTIPNPSAPRHSTVSGCRTKVGMLLQAVPTELLIISLVNGAKYSATEHSIAQRGQG